ncbi:MAG TPA: histidine phosphatase family protein [Candidatus Limnocylindria bacterium]|nr:histidine phosphatase family protein [Candidatus Limnocylindria bacterium]
MAILDIRRHAERMNLADSSSALSAAGRGMCERLATSQPKYALVLSSPLPRAKETAQRIAGRLDGVEPGLLPDIGGSGMFPEMRTLADYARLLRETEGVRAFAEEQIPVWARIASRVGDRDRVLAVSHGGLIDMPAILIAERLGAKLEGASFGYGEGVRVTYAKGAPTKIEALRVG